MALTWDITKIKWPDEYQLWIDNPNPDHKEGEEQVMNAVTEMMIFLTMFIGVNEITKPNHREFYKRTRQFEIVTDTGLLVNPETKESRMPTLEEVKWHIGLKTNATPHTKRKWTGNVMRMLDETISKQDKEVKDGGGDRATVT